MRPLLHCFAVEVIKEGDPEVVKGIITESKSGRQGGNSIAEKSIWHFFGDFIINFSTHFDAEC